MVYAMVVRMPGHWDPFIFSSVKSGAGFSCWNDKPRFIVARICPITGLTESAYSFHEAGPIIQVTGLYLVFGFDHRFGRPVGGPFILVYFLPEFNPLAQSQVVNLQARLNELGLTRGLKHFMTTTQENFRVQKLLTAIIVGLFLIKLAAWYFTNSVAILTDTLEYIINVISGFIGLYSLYLSAKPRDKNHPYGHGKVEFLSATVEGTLMLVSGMVIVFEALSNMYHPHLLKKLDYGIYLVAATGVLNYVAGAYAIRNGRKNNSLSLIASGKHMQSDTYATAGIVIGLILISFTHWLWIDNVLAFVFALIIIFSGYKILRSSIAGIMDEADDDLLDKVVSKLQSQRNENWIDLHNLRIIKYGSTLHLDCHITIPWYFNILKGHDEVSGVEQLVRENFGDSLELFVHTDGCLEFSCRICSKMDCEVRRHPQEKRITWTVANISEDKKHDISTQD